MTTIASSILNVGDVVLVEPHVQRWSTKKDQTERDWTEWGVKLDLQSVSLLHSSITTNDAVPTKELMPFRI